MLRKLYHSGRVTRACAHRSSPEPPLREIPPIARTTQCGVGVAKCWERVVPAATLPLDPAYRAGGHPVTGCTARSPCRATGNRRAIGSPGGGNGIRYVGKRTDIRTGSGSWPAVGLASRSGACARACVSCTGDAILGRASRNRYRGKSRGNRNRTGRRRRALRRSRCRSARAVDSARGRAYLQL